MEQVELRERVRVQEPAELTEKVAQVEQREATEETQERPAQVLIQISVLRLFL